MGIRSLFKLNCDSSQLCPPPSLNRLPKTSSSMNGLQHSLLVSRMSCHSLLSILISLTLIIFGPSSLAGLSSVFCAHCLVHVLELWVYCLPQASPTPFCNEFLDIFDKINNKKESEHYVFSRLK
jgi:hypothetical protein